MVQKSVGHAADFWKDIRQRARKKMKVYGVRSFDSMEHISVGTESCTSTICVSSSCSGRL